MCEADYSPAQNMRGVIPPLYMTWVITGTDSAVLSNGKFNM